MAGELVRPTPAVGQIRKFSTFKLDFLAIHHVIFHVSIFSDRSNCDLSNGASFVSIAWLQKKLLGVQGRGENHRFSENLDFPKNIDFSPNLDASWAHFSQSRVLPPNL